jgi:hypothetical protein
VKKAMDVTQELFQPLQNILNALKAHGMDMSTLPKIGDKVLQDYLDEAPMAWDVVIKKTFKKKEEVRNSAQLFSCPLCTILRIAKRCLQFKA